jgi:hypothetical protein
MGNEDKDKTGFKSTVFNSRKLSPVFTGGPLLEEVGRCRLALSNQR